MLSHAAKKIDLTVMISFPNYDSGAASDKIAAYFDINDIIRLSLSCKEIHR